MKPLLIITIIYTAFFHSLPTVQAQKYTNDSESATGTHRAFQKLEIAVSPEIWYAYWKPNFDAGDNFEKTYSEFTTSYKVAPALLYGLSISAQYHNITLTGNYLMSRIEDKIGKESGHNIKAWDNAIIQIIAPIKQDFYLKNRIFTGSFRGFVEGTESTGPIWSYQQSKFLIDADWFQGDIFAVYDLHKELGDMKYLVPGLGLAIGYRFAQYNIPAKIGTWTMQPPLDWNYNFSFHDTEFRSHYIVAGLEPVPFIVRNGWNLGVTRALIGIGKTQVSNAKLNESCFSLQMDVDVGITYDSRLLGFELGMLFKRNSLSIDAETGGTGGHMGLGVSDIYYGPYAMLTARL